MQKNRTRKKKKRRADRPPRAADRRTQRAECENVKASQAEKKNAKWAMRNAQRDFFSRFCGGPAEPAFWLYRDWVHGVEALVDSNMSIQLHRQQHRRGEGDGDGEGEG